MVTDVIEIGARLTACTEMIAADDALGYASGLKPMPRHAAILPLAIRRIIATAVFLPAPCEVRAAIFAVRDRICRLQATELQPVLAKARAAERLVFKQDRDAWLAPYTSGTAPSAVADYLVDDGDTEMRAAVADLLDGGTSDA